MRKLVINVEEKVDKVVGKRTVPPDPLDIRHSTKEQSRSWSKAFGRIHVPKGVFRFQTHEEADAWLLKMITRRKVN